LAGLPWPVSVRVLWLARVWRGVVRGGATVTSTPTVVEMARAMASLPPRRTIIRAGTAGSRTRTTGWVAGWVGQRLEVAWLRHSCLGGRARGLHLAVNRASQWAATSPRPTCPRSSA
ncbi:hypothetical protein AB1N83_012195, partial [Pleurotus pulmonarius]